jgi:hypothetical protein
MAMGDKQKKPSKKKLAVNKETIRELSEGELDQVAGGIGSAHCTTTGVRAPDQDPGPTRACNAVTSK